MTKPMVFNYQDYVRLQEENKRLREENTNLQIRCRIAESEKPDRDCKSCKHNKPDGCSRWNCEYEPVMSDLIKKSDAIKALYKYNFVSKDVIEREINAIPSADRPQWEWIPVSERLPIPPTFCLVTTDGSHGDVIDIALYMSDGWHKASEVLAWMPLPEPYREDGEA